MFDFLKKKVKSFTEKVKQAIEKKPEKKSAISETKVLEKEKIQAEAARKGEKKLFEKEAEPAERELETVAEKPGIKAEEIAIEKHERASEETRAEKPEEVAEETAIEMPRAKEEIEKPSAGLKPKEDDKRKLEAKKSLKTRLVSVFAKEVSIEEADIKGFLEEFELALLESDVEQDAARAIVEELHKELAGKKISRKENLSEFLKGEIRKALLKVMQAPEKNFWKIAEEKKPFKVMFLGPNGAGKTTSIAKLAFAFKQKGKKVVFASSDTFRAGSIEQIETHAERLGIRVVKHQYGADPAAVAFDAVKAAEAGKADAVFIDTAGRQETNKNLMQELKKINRVIKPDLRIYVGEAFTGQALLQQASEFEKEIGIDGFILTKIDTDAKGGTAISLLYKLKKPILFIGTGQGYEDLEEFKPEFIIDRIV